MNRFFVLLLLLFLLVTLTGTTIAAGSDGQPHLVQRHDSTAVDSQLLADEGVQDESAVDESADYSHDSYDYYYDDYYYTGSYQDNYDTPIDQLERVYSNYGTQPVDPHGASAETLGSPEIDVDAIDLSPETLGAAQRIIPTLQQQRRWRSIPGESVHDCWDDFAGWECGLEDQFVWHTANESVSDDHGPAEYQQTIEILRNLGDTIKVDAKRAVAAALRMVQPLHSERVGQRLPAACDAPRADIDIQRR